MKQTPSDGKPEVGSEPPAAPVPEQTMQLGRVEPEKRFDLANLSVHQVRRYNVQTQIGAILAAVALLSLLALVVTCCWLAIFGHTDRIGPLLQAFEPYILPLLGGIVGYAFGKQDSSNSS